MKIRNSNFLKTIIAIIVVSAIIIVAMFLGGYFEPGTKLGNLIKNPQTTSEKAIPAKLELIPKVEEYKYNTSCGQFVFKKVSESKFVVEYPSKLGSPFSWSFGQTHLTPAVNRNFISVMFQEISIHCFGDKVSFVFTGPQFDNFSNGVLEFEWIAK